MDRLLQIDSIVLAYIHFILSRLVRKHTISVIVRFHRLLRESHHVKLQFQLQALGIDIQFIKFICLLLSNNLLQLKELVLLKPFIIKLMNTSTTFFFTKQKNKKGKFQMLVVQIMRVQIFILKTQLTVYK